jgi:hypothetical protein
MATLPKAIYMFNAIPIKIPMTFFHRNRKINPKIIWKHKRPRTAKAIQSKKSNAGGITIPNFKLYYRAITIKTAWYWHKNRYEDQQNRTEDPAIKPCTYSQLIFNKGAQNTQWKKDSLFNKCFWENWISACRKLKLESYLSPCTNINSKLIKDLNTRPETLKQLQEAVGNTLENIGIGSDFLNRTQKAQHLRERMNKMGLH